MKSFIKAISYYLPETELSNTQLAGIFPEWGAEKIAAKIGVETRHIAGEDEFASDIAVAAANKMFQEHHIVAGEIDFILYCTQSPDYFLPTTACIIQDRLKIPVRAGALDFNLGCSGYIYGLALAKGLIAAGIAANILLLTAETYSKFIHPDDKGNRTIFGDGAAATLVSTAGFAEIGEFVLGTDGAGANNLIVKQGGTRYPATGKTTGSISTEERLDAYLLMNGAEIFNFTAEAVPPLVEEALLKNHVLKTGIGRFIFHQANQFMLNHLRKKLDIPAENFHINMKATGNTVSSTIPIAIADALKEDGSPSKEKWLLAGFGVGYSWGATVITFN